MELWYTEDQNNILRFSYRVNQSLHVEKTPFQHLAVLDTVGFGRMLVLDGIVQTTVWDEFIYHEMIAHVPLNTHPNPKKVLIIGGGDGGTAREVVRHPRVEKAVMVEIDERVVAAAREYLPELSGELDNPKLDLRFTDGIKHVAASRNEYDVVIIDSTDPVGPAVGLFSREFYGQVYQALKEDGLFVAQTESPLFNTDVLARICKDVGAIFPVVRTYLACVPSYPGGLWSFTLGSKKYDPLEVKPEIIPALSYRYYNLQVHRAAFALPQFLKEALGQG
ncbi:polyamine aminopropyltransferase [Thermodesulfitimonas autotrophica]|uniref:polyamine aminopropyltransferase n=1 Tax=Thermodesulfitimonas autotrophica TaxID=1894989 RepID=UPI002FE26F85